MKNVPNILSTIRILLVPLFLYLYLNSSFIFGALGIAVFSIAAFTDFLDGHIARKHDIETTLGTFLDPLADKVLTFSVFIVLYIIDSTLYPLWAILVIILRDVFITLMRIYAERNGHTMKTRNTAKAKTLIQLLFLYIALVLDLLHRLNNSLGDFSRSILDTPVMYYATVFVALLTLYTGLEYIYVNRSFMFKKHDA